MQNATRWEEIVQSRILIVDDQAANIRLLERMLEQAGYQRIESTTDPHQVLALYRAMEPDLIVLDLHMPELDGLELMQQLTEEVPARSYLPILVITADVTAETKLRALLLGAKDFLTKPIDRVETMLRIRILLETRHRFLDLEKEIARLRPPD